MAVGKNTPEIFRFGSTWVRADFHLHTKADKPFFMYSGDEKYYYSSYVEALSSAGIRVGVITNHNKFDKDEFDALRKTAGKKEILLLPGVELSVNDGAGGVHVNLVFSLSWLEEGQDYINPFLSAMFVGKTEQQYRTENGRSDKNILQLVAELEKVGRDYFLIFAHVEESKGLWNELKGGKLSDWRGDAYADVRSRTLGFQKVRTHDLRKKVKDWLSDWYPAEVEGSDCKCIKEIGRGDKCYVKIGSFDFEALKFSLSPLSERLAAEPILHKRSFIKTVLFEGGTLNGARIDFSPELNTLIGIRGSGKSSVIEAIRYGLDVPFGENIQDDDYKAALVPHTLGSGGTITIEAVDGFGQEYEIRRILDHVPEVYIDGILQPGVTVRETVVSRPLYFGQKDLSSSGEGFEKDLVEKLIGAGIDDVRRKIEEQKERVRQAVGRYRKLEDIGERKEEHTRKKTDAEFQLKRYKKYGLEEKLKKQVDFDADDRKLTEMNEAVDAFRDSLAELLRDHEDDLRNHAIYKSKQNAEFFKEYFDVYRDVLVQLDTVSAAAEALKKIFPDLKRKREAFSGVINGLKEEFAASERKIAEDLKAAGIPVLRPDEYRQLNKTIEQTQAILAELEKEETKAESIHKNLLREISTLNDLRLEEFKLIKQEMEKVNSGNSSLSIEVLFKNDKESFKTFLRDMMRGSNLREVSFGKAVERFVDPAEIFRDKSALEELLGPSAAVFWDYFMRNLEDFLVWQVPNSYTIKYKGKKLGSHSLGQRASALILFVLTQKDHDLIIIDQPEDDLDNQTIYQDVIKLIRKLKIDTQFVFATHNPNFPVLGDAEMVLSCEYADDRILIKQGSVDDKCVQERIVNVMEGGEEAFNRRKEIYGIWKPRNSSK